MDWDVEYACCIYPCVPFLQTTDLADALVLMQENEAYFAYPVTDYVHPIQRAMRRLSTGKMEFFQSEHELTRTQDLEKSYHDTGQFYWGKASAWKAQMKMHTAGVGLVVPNWRVVDIDNLEDWRRAELLYAILNQ
jgi:CMP-N-acetylneuraminic acid synthetase